MPFDLGALIGAGVTGARGIQEGIANRKLMEQQAMQQLLAKRLTEAQIANYQSEAATRGQKSVTRFTDRGLEVSRDGGMTWQPAQRVGGGSVGAPMKGRYQVTTDEFGNVTEVYVPDPREMQGEPGTPASPPGAPATPQGPTVGGGRPRSMAVPGVRGRSSPAARETNAAAGTTIRLIGEALDLSRDEKNMSFPLGAEVVTGAANLASKVGAGGLMRPFARMQLSPEQTAFRQKMDQILHFGGSILPKGGRSQRIMENLQQSYSPGAGVTNLPVFRQALQDFQDYARQIYVPGATRGSPYDLQFGGHDQRSPQPSTSSLDAAEAALGIRR